MRTLYNENDIRTAQENTWHEIQNVTYGETGTGHEYVGRKTRTHKNTPGHVLVHFLYNRRHLLSLGKFQKSTNEAKRDDREAQTHLAISWGGFYTLLS